MSTKNEAAPQAQVRGLAAKAPRPIVGKTLRLLSGCRSYAVDIYRDEAALPQWRHAAELMLAAAEGGDLEEVVLQFERILIHQNELVPQGFWRCSDERTIRFYSHIVKHSKFANDINEGI